MNAQGPGGSGMKGGGMTGGGGGMYGSTGLEDKGQQVVREIRKEWK